MRNDSEEFCREKQNTYFLFNTFFFRKLLPFMRQCGKVWSSQTDHGYQYHTEHALCILDN
jgi:phosphatidylserine decarboxylase